MQKTVIVALEVQRVFPRDGRRRASAVHGRQACARPRLVREHAKRYEADCRHVCQRTGPRTRRILRIQPLGDRLPQVPSQLGYEPTLLPCERKDALRSMWYPS